MQHQYCPDQELKTPEMSENNKKIHLVRQKKHNIGEKQQFSSPPGILLEQIFVCAAGKLDTSKTFPETSINIFPTDIDRLLAENMCFRLNTKCNPEENGNP